MSGKIPSPCLDVCKFKRERRCIGCGMTEKEEKRFDKLDGRAAKRAFVLALAEENARREWLGHWPKAYRKKCRKKGLSCPLDEDGVNTSEKR